MKNNFQRAFGPFLFFTALIIHSSCASQGRSKYQAYKDKEGYKDLPPMGELKVVSFKANAYTKKNEAELFAKFRAIENCLSEKFKLANILAVKDESISKDIIRTYGSGYPSYYYGMSPFYGRYHSGFGLGFSSMSTNSWEETYTYPEFIVTYQCTNKAFGPEIVLREVTSDDMKLLVKDLKGALQVEEIIKESPNLNNIEVGDVILRAHGERIQTIPQLLKHFDQSSKQVSIDIMREGLRKKIVLKSKDVSEFLDKSQREIIRAACEKEEISKKEICKN